MKNFVIAFVLLLGTMAMAATGNFISGTGVVINRNYIVTASHIVHEHPYTCMYDAATGECHPVKVIADEPDADMAIVRLGTNRGSRRLGACAVVENEVPVGTKVYTYGYPSPFTRNNFDQHRYESRIKALDNYFGDDRMYRISVQLTEGYSGGPSFDEYGRVIGISRSYSLIEDNVSNIVKSSVIAEFLDDYGIGIYPTTRNMSKCTVMLVNSERKF